MFKLSRQAVFGMADCVERRKTLVQTLRRLARNTAVPLVRDDVGFDRVASFAQAIADSDLGQVEKNRAQEVFAAYLYCNLCWTRGPQNSTSPLRKFRAFFTLGCHFAEKRHRLEASHPVRHRGPSTMFQQMLVPGGPSWLGADFGSQN